MRRVKDPVPLRLCMDRALEYLRKQPRHPGHFVKASEVAGSIWPGVEFASQGAGAAASRILKLLEKQGLAAWSSDGHNWGWRLKCSGF